MLIIVSVMHTVTQTDQGIKGLDVDKAGKLAGGNPDYAIKDLYESIANNTFVSTLDCDHIYASE